MALSWIERIQHFFTAPPKYATWETIGKRLDAAKIADALVTPEPVKPELTEFEKIYTKFNLKTDMIVLSAEKAGSLSDDERAWLNSLGNRVYYFADDSLVNIAIIKSW